MAVTLTGQQFAPGVTTAVAVSGSGVGVTNVAVQNATTVTATLTIAPDAALGARTISVTNTGGTGQGLTFTVLPLPPTLDTIDPPVVRAGASAVLTLKGTNFINGTTTVAVSGTGLSVGGVSVTDATTLTVSVSASLTAELSAREVTVTTPGGTSSHEFIVVAPPALVVTNVTGGRLRIGETTTIRISGSGFVPGITTLVSNHPALQVLAVRISNAPASTVPGRARPASFSATGSSLEADLKALSGFSATTGPANILAVTQNLGSFIASIVDNISRNVDRILGHFGTLFDGEFGDFGEIEIDIPLIIVPPRPLIAAFEAAPALMFVGESSTLKWRGIEHATTCSISSIGDVPCADGGVVVSPAATTEYRLTATGSAGDFEWADVTVAVAPRPAPAPAPAPSPTSSATFSTVGIAESFTVPAGVTQVTLEVSGGSGGAGAGSTPSNSGAAGGLGGRVTATVAVTPGETLTVMVGGLGSNAVNGGAFGFGGGAGSVGNGANSGGTGLGGGGGGGASSVRRGSTMLAIAGGGGGGGGNFGAVLGGTGGAGGGAGAAGNGQTTADSGNGGAGATQSAVGTGGTGAGHPGGTGSSGSGRDGGEGGPASNASSGAGGGAGGGAFGGGGGGGGASAHASIHSGGGGGGGSSTTIGSATSVTHQQGVQSGNGLVVIRW